MPCWETGYKCMYVCILHLYYIFGCNSGLQCQVSDALVTGHYTWVARHVPYACIPCTFTHCIICTLQGGYSSGYLGTVGRLGTRSQSWEKASGIGHPRAIQLHSFQFHSSHFIPFFDSRQILSLFFLFSQPIQHFGVPCENSSHPADLDQDYNYSLDIIVIRIDHRNVNQDIIRLRPDQLNSFWQP